MSFDLAFQFTRARGARLSTPSSLSKATCFNSRAHGARDTEWLQAGTRRRVSIHARTGRATWSYVILSEHSDGFNSRAHGARDLKALYNQRPT